MQRRPLSAAALFAMGLLASPASPAAETLRDSLVGTWRLVAATQRLADGSTRPDPQPGPHGVGYIMYAATGHVCVVIANPDRPAWKTPSAPSDAEVRSAFQGLVAYCGTFETDEKEGSVTHHIQADREPHVVGTDRKRLAAVTGARLVLRPTALPPGVEEWTVEWERAGPVDPASDRKHD
jgi:hypothetical protein